MTRAAEKPRCEPEENEFLALDVPEAAPAPAASGGAYAGLLRGMLEQVVETVAHLKAAGLEDALRARLADVLPARPAAASPPADLCDRLLALSNSAHLFDEHARRAKPGSPNAKRNAACAAALRAEIEILKREARS